MAGSSDSGSITGHSHLKAELDQDLLPSSDTWFPVEWCTDYSLQAVLKSLTTCSSPKGSSLQPLVSAEDVGERLRGSTAVFFNLLLEVTSLLLYSLLQKEVTKGGDCTRVSIPGGRDHGEPCRSSLPHH